MWLLAQAALLLSFGPLADAARLVKRKRPFRDRVASTRGRGSRSAPTAKEVLAAMGRGVNLGNLYDVKDVFNDVRYETQVARIDAFVAKGFQHIRLPVTWARGGVQPNFAALSDKLKTVERVVRYALSKGIYVVLDTHHERWLKRNYDGSDEFNRNFRNIWVGISKMFKDVDHKLVFEILNEPEDKMGSFGESPDPRSPKAIRLTKQINEIGYWAVRSVSPQRVVLVAPNGMGSHKMARFVYPTRGSLPGPFSDRYIGVTIHSYDPAGFCQIANGQNAFFKDIAELRRRLLFEHSGTLRWISRSGIPVHLGEYGVARPNEDQSERDTEMVREYYRFQTNMFQERGVPTSVWSDQGWYRLLKEDKQGGRNFVYGLVDAVLDK